MNRTSDETWNRFRQQGNIFTDENGIEKINREGRWDHGLTRQEYDAAAAIAHALESVNELSLSTVKAAAKALRREWRKEERREAHCEMKMMQSLGID